MTKLLKNIQAVKIASNEIKNLTFEKRNKIISEIGKSLKINKELIKKENHKDLEKMDKNNPMYDRLLLTDSRIEAMSEACYDLVKIPDPLNKYNIEDIIKTEDKLEIKKVGVSLGVVSCIYEARPNVTIDLSIMCFKSGNAIILRGGSSAKYSNDLLVGLIKSVLKENDINENIIYNFPLEREKLDELYNAVGLVDVIIPRGGKSLIDSVRKKSIIPVIETGAGVVHLYLDDRINKQNYEKVIDVIVNAKTNRVSVCNALDTLIINKNITKDLIKKLFESLKENGSVLINDSIDYYTEQLSLNLNIKYVDSIDEAIEHIQKYSSKHSDGILSDDEININKFNKNIDSSVVYTNTSTRFSDGSCFGFGGEIGISTQKLHARGPMGAESLVTYKYIINSNWAVRN